MFFFISVMYNIYKQGRLSGWVLLRSGYDLGEKKMDSDQPHEKNLIRIQIIQYFF